MNINIQPLVSVIIPVFNDVDRLKRCLEGLKNQTYARDRYEIIVVDNNSDESLEPVAAAFPELRLASETTPGSYAARNKGISLATGEILAFTDADCLPPPDWIANGVANLVRTPNCGLVTGPVKIFVSDPANPTLIELHESLMAFPKKQHNEKLVSAVTANIFTSKQVIETVGPFNAHLKSTGDKEWTERVVAHGYDLVYAEEVYVEHPARRSWREVYQRSTRLAGGFYDRKKHQRSLTRQIGGIIWSWMPPVRRSLQVLTDPRLKGSKQRIKFVFLEFFMNYVMALERLRLTLGGQSRRI